jgi:hypothetical protein
MGRATYPLRAREIGGDVSRPDLTAMFLDERPSQGRCRRRRCSCVMSDDFAVRCMGCHFTWNTPAMAEGLRVLGACPKCKGELEYGTRCGGSPAADASETRDAAAAAPHLVLGIPRI